VWSARVEKAGAPLYGLGNGSPKSARIITYWLHVGDIPENHKLYLQDTCDPRCVNPHHFVVSRVNPKLQKLTADSVRCIRAREEPEDVLAERYDVHVATIRDVRRYRTWKDVT